MNSKSFLESIDDETLAKLIDTTLKFEQNQKAEKIKLNILKIVPAVAAIVLVIGLINLAPVFFTTDSGGNLSQAGSNAGIAASTEAPTTTQDFTDPTALFVPPIVEKTFFEEQILAGITGRDHAKLLAYYTLKDPSAPELTEEEKQEMILGYPICERVPVYVCDPNASARELMQLLSILKFYTYLGSDLLQMCQDFDIPYEIPKNFVDGSYVEVDENGNVVVAGESTAESQPPEPPSYGMKTAEDGTQYLEFKNKSLYAALMEYFGLDRWYGDYITSDMLKQITSLSARIRPEYSYLYDNIGLREEFGLNCQYIEYTINGKTLDILPEKFKEGGVLEGHMEMAELDINDYFDYDNGYYVTKPGLSVEDKLRIYKILAWGGAMRTPVEQNSDGSYYTTFDNASWSIYTLGFLARYYDQPKPKPDTYNSEYFSDCIYMPNLPQTNFTYEERYY